MLTKKKPLLVQHVLFEKRIIGAVMLDDKGYFYRPKRTTSIVKSAHNPKWDGEHMQNTQEVLNLVWGE